MVRHSDRKAQARAYAAAHGLTYQQALQRMAAERAHQEQPQANTAPAVQITTITITPEPVDATWKSPRGYRCQCGQTGALTRAVARVGHVGYVTEDGRTSLLAHCPACLPPVAGDGWSDEHAARSTRSWDLICTLRTAVESGRHPGVRRTDLYLCPRCGAWSVDPRITLPLGVLLDTGKDLYVHPCPDCWQEQGAQACADAQRRCAHELARGNWG
ncbi:hypothetical protein ACFFMN_40310 [Planobispora siamensis]|uniref:Uncharacterized protein n=1 Tax=Planobispora siamensis TaxID=936338 RepID=A0A8J3SS49_9ACTN|nr:hypothetical protein [Planobispora siamensis]GIH97857.1 hypothetical protein Psi01_84870 [Planobispora siamensis]